MKCKTIRTLFTAPNWWAPLHVKSLYFMSFFFNNYLFFLWPEWDRWKNDRESSNENEWKLFPWRFGGYFCVTVVQPISRVFCQVSRVLQLMPRGLGNLHRPCCLFLNYNKLEARFVNSSFRSLKIKKIPSM